MRTMLEQVLLFKEGLPGDLLAGCRGDGGCYKVFGQAARKGRRGPSGQGLLPVSLSQ